MRVAWLFLLICGALGAAPPNVHKKLDADTEMAGYVCAKGDAWFYANGALGECKLAREAVFGVARAEVGTWITLSVDGKPEHAMFPRDVRIGNVTCMGSAMGREGISTAFYPSGKLRMCFLADDQEIDGVPCARGGFLSEVMHGNASVEFTEAGALRSCRLSRAATVAGQRRVKHERVTVQGAK